MDSLEINLVRQAQRGKKEAMEQLFLMEKEYLYKMAFLYMKNKEDSLDIVQECILRCIVSIKSLKQSGPGGESMTLRRKRYLRRRKRFPGKRGWICTRQSTG